MGAGRRPPPYGTGAGCSGLISYGRIIVLARIEYVLTVLTAGGHHICLTACACL
jgi:hypothetical protein